MTDTGYQLSRGVFRIMESIFLWIYNLFASGSLSFFIRNWIWVALFVSAAAIIIDHLLSYLLDDKPPNPFVELVKKLYVWVRVKINPGWEHEVALSFRSSETEADTETETRPKQIIAPRKLPEGDPRIRTAMDLRRQSAGDEPITDPEPLETLAKRNRDSGGNTKRHDLWAAHSAEKRKTAEGGEPETQERTREGG